MADEEDDFLYVYEPTPLRSAEERARAQSQQDADEAAAKAIRERRVAYQRLFVLGMPTPDDVQLVMLDLATFCRGFESTFGETDRASQRLDGRREVFLRIMDFTRLDYDELMIKYHRS